MAVSLTFKGSDQGARATAEALARSLDQLGIASDSVKFKLQEQQKSGDNLFQATKDWTREQSQQGRVARSLVGELSDLIPMSSAAAGSLQGLAGVLVEGAAGGLSFGLAFEAIKFGITLVRDWTQEADKAAAAWKKAGDSVAAFGKPMEDKLHVLTLKAQGFTDAMVEAVAVMQRAGTVELPDGRKMSGNEAIVEAGIESNKARSSYDAKKNAIPAARNLSDEDAQRFYPNLRKDMEEAQKWEAFRAQLEEVEKNARRVATAEHAKDKAKTAADDQKDANQHTLFMLQKQAELAAGEDRIRLEGQMQEEQIRARHSGAINAEAREELAAVAKVTAAKLDAYRVEMENRQQAAIWDAQMGADDKRAKDAEVAKRKAQQDAREKLAQIRAEQQAMAQAGAQIATVFNDVGSAIGGTAGNMMQLFGKLIQQAIQLAVAMSATGGPYAWLNVAVAAASIISTLASIPEFRAEGGPVVNGRPYIVGERGPELIIPSSAGTVVPNDQLGGTSNVTVNVTTQDAKSFERFLRSQDNALLKVLDELRRDGRL
jgi:hypothetical protein